LLKLLPNLLELDIAAPDAKFPFESVQSFRLFDYERFGEVEMTPGVFNNILSWLEELEYPTHKPVTTSFLPTKTYTPNRYSNQFDAFYQAVGENHP
jgi:hypothetical protein